MKKHWKLGIFGALVGAIIVGYLLLPQRPAIPVLPVPNGYEDLRKAAQQAVSDRHLVYGEASDEELKDLVDRNRAALTLARSGGARECRVTTDYGLAASVYAAQHLPVLAQFKKLALAFRAEGELAEREGKTNDAVRIYLDGVRFAQELCRGGLLIDRMVGVATERINLDPLLSSVPNLDAVTCREAARALEQMEVRREPIRATWNEETLWASRVASLQERMGLQIVRIVRPKDFNAPWEKSASKLAEVQTQARALMLQLAVRACEVDHAKSPDEPRQLVPKYLQAIPKDPVTGKELTIGP
jgi:hypothetical protein